MSREERGTEVRVTGLDSTGTGFRLRTLKPTPETAIDGKQRPVVSRPEEEEVVPTV